MSEVTGSNDDDIIISGNGSDTINGGSGNDIIISGNGSDTVEGGEGNDIILSGNGSDTVNGGDGEDIIMSGNGSDIVDGGDGDDIIDGGNGNDTIDGGDGNDTINGGNGSDTLNGGDGDDTIDGGNGSDTIDGGEGNDLIMGGNGADIISGGSGDDVIYGENGSDELYDGSGSDLVYGNAGNDNFHHILNENVGDYDVFDGNGGTDKLIIYATANQISELQLAINAFNQQTDKSIEFDFNNYVAWSNLKIKNIEQIEFVQIQNAAPEANAISVSFDEDQPIQAFNLVNLMAAQDSDAGDVVTISNVGISTSSPSFNFQLVNGEILIDPNQFNDLDDGEILNLALDVTFTDGTDTITKTFSIIVNGITDDIDPVAVDDNYNAIEDAALNGASVLANDTDADGGLKEVVSVNGGAIDSNVNLASGASVNMQSDGTFVYNQNGAFDTLAAGEQATDTFSYTLNGGSTATVSILINGVDDAPVAVADGVNIAEDEFLFGSSVLINDTDVDGGPMSVTSMSGGMVNKFITIASGATVNMQADGTFTYNQNGAFNYLADGEQAIDTFTYTLNGGSTATVSITITGIDDAPVAVSDSYNMIENVPLNGSALANDTDVDGGLMEVISVNGGAVNSNIVLASGATVNMQADGTFVYDVNGAFSTLGAGQQALDAFTYTLNGGNTATVHITIQGVDDAPIAQNDNYNVFEDSNLNGASVLNNDSDPDGGLKQVTSVNGGAVNSSILLASGASIIMQADGTFAYNQNGAFNSLTTGQQAVDSFTYEVNGGSSATVNITVVGVDDAPVAVADSYTVTENVHLAGSSVLVNDTDVDGGPMSVTSMSGGAVNKYITIASGATVNMKADGTFTYDQNGAFNYLSDGEEAIDTFTYTLNGGSSATVSVTITGVGPAPLAPIMIDLDQDGLELINMQQGISKDVDNDGQLEQVGWVGQDDGILAIDLGGDKIINSMKEFVFTLHDETAKTDMEAVRNVFDSNRDGALSADDEAWGSFGIWQDSNQDGVSQAGEFYTLDELGFIRLDLVSDDNQEIIEGNIIYGKAELIHQSGMSLTAYDGALSYSDVIAEEPLFETTAPVSDISSNGTSAEAEPLIQFDNNNLESDALQSLPELI